MNKLSQYYYRIFNPTFCTLCLLFYNPALYAEEKLTAGRVVVVRGDVAALNSAGDRVLVRGAEIFVGDTITTGPTGFVQLRLQDSAIVALKADTAFEITEYTFNPASGQTERATLNLIQGGFRTISGSIGEADREAYRVDTPFATIGIRGTDHENNITGDGLFSAAYQGGIRVGNSFGFVDAGARGDFDFVHVASPNSLPEGILDQPSELGGIHFVELEDETEEEADDDEGDNAPGALNTDPQSRQLPSATSFATLRDDHLINPDLSGGGANGPGFLLVAVNPNESGDGAITCRSDPSICINPDPQPDPVPQPGEAALAPQYVTRGTHLVSAFNLHSADEYGSGGNVSGAVVLGKNNVNPGWGVWGLPVSGILEDLYESDDAPIAFSDLALTPAVVLARMRGHYNYSNVENNFIGASTKGDVTNVEANFTMNFDDGKIGEGELSVEVQDPLNLNERNWVVQFDGALNDEEVTLNIINGQVAHIDPVTTTVTNLTDVSGNSSIRGEFTGFEADGFLGGFELIDAGNSENTTQGVFLLGKDHVH